MDEELVGRGWNAIVADDDWQARWSNELAIVRH